MSYHVGISIDNEIIFGAQSLGYRTKYQNMIEDYDTGFYDAHLYKFNPDSRSDCLYSIEVKSRDLKLPY